MMNQEMHSSVYCAFLMGMPLQAVGFMEVS